MVNVGTIDINIERSWGQGLWSCLFLSSECPKPTKSRKLLTLTLRNILPEFLFDILIPGDTFLYTLRLGLP